MVELSADQAAVYDRQLRVWGHEVQKRLSSARILVVGSRGLAAEVAKNLVLAGVGHIGLQSDCSCRDSGVGSFLVTSEAPSTNSVAEASAKTLQEMNPFVKVVVEPGNPSELSMEALNQYDLVFATDLSLEQTNRIDQLCTEAGVKLFAGTVRGLNSYVFANLQKHVFHDKREKPVTDDNAEPTISKPAADSKQEESLLEYVQLKQALSVPLSHLTKRSHPLYGVLRVCAAFEAKHGKEPSKANMEELKELAAAMKESEGGSVEVNGQFLEEWVSDVGDFAAVASIVGGVVANHIIRTVSKVNAPLRNFFFFSVRDGLGVVEDMH